MIEDFDIVQYLDLDIPEKTLELMGEESKKIEGLYFKVHNLVKKGKFFSYNEELTEKDIIIEISKSIRGLLTKPFWWKNYNFKHVWFEKKIDVKEEVMNYFNFIGN